MRLSEVQSRFKDLMLDHPDALNMPDQDFAAIFESGRVPLSRRLKVYRNNIVGSLTDMMAATFPLIVTLVGQDFFEGCARRFILQNPPRQGCLNLYGAGFDDFLRGFAPAASLPYLSDVATFELAMNAAYYAPNVDALTPERLSSVAPDELPAINLPLCPYVALLSSAYHVLAIQDFCQNGGEGTLDIDQGGVRLMIIRPHLSVDVVSLDEAEFTMLSLLQQGRSLGDSIEVVLNQFSDFDFQYFLQKHLTLKTFAAFEANTQQNGE